jgi:hypothetical protein
MTGVMDGIMTMGDPSVLHQAAKQYAVDVAFAGVAKTTADGASGVTFVSGERLADTFRDRAINTADNALAVAQANASKAQAIRDAGFKADYLYELAAKNAIHTITIAPSRKSQRPVRSRSLTKPKTRPAPRWRLRWPPRIWIAPSRL